VAKAVVLTEPINSRMSATRKLARNRFGEISSKMTYSIRARNSFSSRYVTGHPMDAPTEQSRHQLLEWRVEFLRAISKPTVSRAGFVTRRFRISFLELAITHGNE
jgi:hypothetical protein